MGTKILALEAYLEVGFEFVFNGRVGTEFLLIEEYPVVGFRDFGSQV